MPSLSLFVAAVAVKRDPRIQQLQKKINMLKKTALQPASAGLDDAVAVLQEAKDAYDAALKHVATCDRDRTFDTRVRLGVCCAVGCVLGACLFNFRCT